MKRRVFVLLLILLSAAFSSAFADSTVLVSHKESYICGNSFELAFPDVPGTSTMISSAGSIHAEAGTDDRLLQVRV